VIVPGVEHHVEPSTDAKFFIQFYRQPGADTIPEHAPDIPTADPDRGSTADVIWTPPTRSSRW
jgi:hypothetical protein